MEGVQEGAVLPQPAFPENRLGLDTSGLKPPRWAGPNPGEKGGLSAFVDSAGPQPFFEGLAIAPERNSLPAKALCPFILRPLQSI